MTVSTQTELGVTSLSGNTCRKESCVWVTRSDSNFGNRDEIKFCFLCLRGQMNLSSSIFFSWLCPSPTLLIYTKEQPVSCFNTANITPLFSCFSNFSFQSPLFRPGGWRWCSVRTSTFSMVPTVWMAFCPCSPVWSVKWFHSYQSQSGLRLGRRFLTAVFTHIWFSKWIFLSWHYWSETQYNGCLALKCQRGGLILPHFPKLVCAKHSMCCFTGLDWALSACVCSSTHARKLVRVARDQIK